MVRRASFFLESIPKVARHCFFESWGHACTQSRSCWNEGMNGSRCAYLSCLTFLPWECLAFVFLCHEYTPLKKAFLLEWKYEWEPMSLPWLPHFSPLRLLKIWFSCHIFLAWDCQPFAFVCHECTPKTKPCLLEWKYEWEPMSLP